MSVVQPVIEIDVKGNFRQTQLKGYKVSVKDFRKNLLLKSRCSRNNKKTQHSGTMSPCPLKTESRMSTPRSNLPMNRTKHYFATQPKYALQFSEYRKFIEELDENNDQDKRMSEYLMLLIKKREEEDEKQMQRMLDKQEGKKMGKLNSTLPSPSGYVKRFKAHSVKVKRRQQKQDSFSQVFIDLEQSQKKEQESWQKIIARIHRTEQYRKKTAPSETSIKVKSAGSPFKTMGSAIKVGSPAGGNLLGQCRGKFLSHSHLNRSGRRE